jgi:hypothetical protein
MQSLRAAFPAGASSCGYQFLPVYWDARLEKASKKISVTIQHPRLGTTCVPRCWVLYIVTKIVVDKCVQGLYNEKVRVGVAIMAG